MVHFNLPVFFLKGSNQLQWVDGCISNIPRSILWAQGTFEGQFIVRHGSWHIVNVEETFPTWIPLARTMEPNNQQPKNYNKIHVVETVEVGILFTTKTCKIFSQSHFWKVGLLSQSSPRISIPPDPLQINQPSETGCSACTGSHFLTNVEGFAVQPSSTTRKWLSKKNVQDVGEGGNWSLYHRSSFLEPNNQHVKYWRCILS